MRADTVADIRLYTEVGLVPVQCAACGVEVGVKKNSRRHTSIQWTASAVRQCREFAAGVGDTSGGLQLGCGRLRESIAAAVADGTIVVPDA
ncbi:MAG: hypothetical protein ACTHMS_04920 [Jatrophihabitans sp.]|uniref:hypothetical protein n=1 Tax=Jatrophihabitans sp. TaxID=1932789 RepID=UPI003F7D1F9B